jgi:proliferating cell nuclear antigen
MNNTISKRAVSFTTSGVMSVRTLVEVLSGIITETPWVIYGPDKNDPNKFAGIEISTADPSRTIFIKVRLFSSSSEFIDFSCKYEKLELGISLINLHKLLKSVDKDDTLTMYVEDSDKQNLVMKIDSPNKKVNHHYKLKLMDLEPTQKKSSKVDFDVKITMSCIEFHKLCKEMSNIADYIEIKCTSKNIMFTCKGDFAERSTVFKSEEGGLNISSEGKKTQTIIQGIFELKNIVLFSKCANLCNDVQIFMKNNFPLTIVWTIATLGNITVALSPIKEDNIKDNYSYSSSDDD